MWRLTYFSRISMCNVTWLVLQHIMQLTLQHAATQWNTRAAINDVTLQHRMQLTLQHTATHCNTVKYKRRWMTSRCNTYCISCCNAMQGSKIRAAMSDVNPKKKHYATHTATHCSTPCCNTVQYVRWCATWTAKHNATHTATHCSTLCCNTAKCMRRWLTSHCNT